MSSTFQENNTDETYNELFKMTELKELLRTSLPQRQTTVNIIAADSEDSNINYSSFTFDDTDIQSLMYALLEAKDDRDVDLNKINGK